MKKILLFCLLIPLSGLLGQITRIIDATGDGGGNSLNGSMDIAVDGSGNVYVVGVNSDNAFKITPGGVITEIINATGDGSGNTLDGPYGIAVDGSGNVYVTGNGSDNVFKITPGGAITEIIDATGDGAGNTLDGPYGIAVDGSGNVYVAGLGSNNAFKITPVGVITEIIDATGDGSGNTISWSTGITVDGSGNVYVVGYFSKNAFKITTGGVITEIIDATGDGGGKTLTGSMDIAVDGSGNVYVPGSGHGPGASNDYVFKITPGGVITEIVDDGGGNTLNGCTGIAVDGSSNVYVTGGISNNAFKVTPGGVITEIIDATGDGGGNTLDDPWGIAVDGSGNVYVAGSDSDNAFKINPLPVVTSTSPANGAHSAAVSTNVSTTFDLNINTGTVSDATFVAHTGFAGRLLSASGDGTWTGSTNTATLNPNVDFHAGELVQMTVTDGIENPDGDATTPHVWQFRTQTATSDGIFLDSGHGSMGTNNQRAALGDLDGDGDLDAFVVRYNDVGPEEPDKVWLNNGSGEFTEGQNLDPTFSTDVALGDVDGDGDLDAFVTVYDDENKVWRNNGSGTFTEITHSFGSFKSVNVDLGDVDGDGDLDAFVINSNEANQLWLNNGAGVFSNSLQSLGSGEGSEVALGDIDNDGDLDAYIAWLSSPDKVWLNDGAGTFTEGAQDLGNDDSRGVSLGDLNGDGYLDVFLANADDIITGTGNTVWLNDGAGGFTNSNQSLGGNVSLHATLGDIDGDGDLDAFVVNALEPNKIWLNNGGTFTDSNQSLGNNSSTSVALGDVDGDGDLDAFVTNFTHSSKVWINSSPMTLLSTDPVVNDIDASVQTIISATFDANVEVPSVSHSSLVVHSNFRGKATASDGTWHATGADAVFDPSADFQPGEIVQVSATSSLRSVDDEPPGNTFVWQFHAAVNDGSGFFQDSGQIFTPHAAAYLELGDVNGDGHLDAVIPDFSGANKVMINNGSGVFTDSGEDIGTTGSLDVVLGDVDNDGDLDIVKINQFDIQIYINDGSGGFTDTGQNFAIAGCNGMALADLDGNGTLDLFFAIWDGGGAGAPNEVWFNDGGGNFTIGQLVGDSESSDVALADVDCDGDLDAFVTNLDEADKVWLNDSTGSFTDSNQNLGATSSRRVALGDLNGDGYPEAVVVNSDEANRVWNNNNGSFQDSIQDLSLTVDMDVTLGDVDGDGDLDVLIASLDGPNKVWLNDGSGQLSDSQQNLGGNDSGGVRLGDLDGNGTLDAFVTNDGQANKVWLNQRAHNAGDVVINEIMWTGSTASDLDEWIELRNMTNAAIDLSGWELTNNIGGEAKLLTIGSGTIPANGYFLASYYNEATSKIDVTPDIVSFLDSLYNSQLQLKLYQGQWDGTGKLIDTAGDGGAPLAGNNTNKQAMARKDPPGDGTQAGNWFTSTLSIGWDAGATEKGTPGSSNIPLVVQSVSPANSSHTGAVSADVTVTFDDDVSAVSVSDATLVAHTQYTGQFLAVDGAWSAAAQAATLNPAINFKPGELVQVTATQNVRGVNGAYTQPHVWQFRTAVSRGWGTFGAAAFDTFGGGYSYSVAMGDVDGDGDLDACIANGISQAQEVWLNQGGAQGGTAGDFGAAAFDAFGGGNSTSVALGDVDGDGDLDACIANANQAQEVWLNQGGAQGGTAGDFGAAAFDTFGAGSSYSVALGDLDGDGDLDACIANWFSQAQEVWLNQGGAQGGTAGDFGAAAFDTFGGGYSYSVALGDLDGDGDLDACIANGISQVQEVWLNQGGAQGGTAGDFGAAAFDTFGADDSRSVALGDLDGDGDLDACIANYTGQAQEVWLNQGGGDFGAAAFDTFGAGSSTSVALGDVDGDGDLDACIANHNQAQEVWLNQGGGDFGAAAFDTFGAGSSTSVALGDLDGDGDLDACIANYYQAQEVWLNQGLDFGDMPAAYNNTVITTDNGARHEIPYTGAINLGTTIDTETDGQESADAGRGATSGDDNTSGSDDEDGITVTGTPWYDGTNGGSVQVVVTGGSGYLSAWIDWDGNNSFADAGDQIFNMEAVSSGPQTLSFNIPAGTITSTTTYNKFARFRLDDQNTTPMTTTGLVTNGEVEDHYLQFTGEAVNVIATSPENGTHSGAVSTDVSVTFNKNINAGTVSDATFVAHTGFGGRLLSSEGSWSGSGATATLNPNTDFKPGELVQMTVTSGLQNGGFTQPYVWQFQTAVSRGWGTFFIRDWDTYRGSGWPYRGQFSPDAALGDLDGDGDLDAFVVSDGRYGAANYNRVWINQGGAQGGTAGDYQHNGQILGSSESYGVSLGDVDGDGDLDAFVVNSDDFQGMGSADKANRVWVNQGGTQGGTEGQFQDSGQTLGSFNSMDVSLGDVDGDGDLDAFVANDSNQANRVYVNQGGIQGGTEGQFQDGGQTLGSYNSNDVSLGDVDGDGDLDAVVANGSNQANRVYENQGDAQGGAMGQFQDSGQTLGSYNSYGVSLGDVDGDGDLDAYVANISLQTDRLWLNQGGAQGGTIGDFQDSGQTLESNDSDCVSLGDVDGDGDLDAFVDANGPRVWVNQGGAQGGTLGQFEHNGQIPHYDYYGRSISLGDVDGDGDLDAFASTTGVGGFTPSFAVLVNQGYDMGDLPPAYTLTLRENVGPRHDIPYSGAIHFGTNIDHEGEGQESADAGRAADSGDDNVSDTDDEDGITVTGTPWREGTNGGSVQVTVTGGSGYLSAWIDWNGNDSFGDAGDQVFNMQAVSAGTNTYDFDIPVGAIPSNTTYNKFARFRLDDSNTTPMTTTGLVTNGEVEDHYLQFTGAIIDFGDAPDPLGGTAGQYPTLLANNGARHIIDVDLKLGALIDKDSNGQPTVTADGDDNDGTDDDDGVTNLSQLVLYKGVAPEIDLALVNTTGSTATIKGWIDYNRNGVFEAGESATTTADNGATEATLTFPIVPQDAASSTYARFRIATNGAEIANPTGMANDGEVEDYPVSIGGVQVVLVSPVGDEWFSGGSSQRIEWYTIPAGVGSVDLYCSFDGGQNYHDVIGTGLPNVGFHVWEVPAVNNQFCRVKIDVIGSLLATTTSASNFTIDSTPPKVNMTNPTSGQTWSGGTTYDITWDATDNFGFGAQVGESSASIEGTPEQTSGTGPISIQYSFDNWTTDKYYVIASGEANDGHFAWTVPMSLLGQTIQIKVRAVDRSGNVACGHHTGDIVIVASPEPIQITSPNGGETFAAGSSQKITWSSNASGGKIDLYYSMDSGDSYPNVIAKDEVNDGSYDWTVPDINTQHLRIKTVLSGPVDQEDVSDQDLTVDGLAPMVELTSPNTGLTLEAGGSVEIAWTAQDNFDLEDKPISLFYSTDGGSTFPNAIVQSIENNGKYTWNVPADLNSSKVRLRVEAVDKAGLKASSSSKQNMTIAPLTLALTYPNGGDVFAGGETKTITWASILSEGTITLRYTTDGGKTWPHTIANDEENDGKYDWTLPGLNSQNVSIKITLQSAQVHEDQANGTFTIDSTPPSIELQSFTGGDSVEAGGKYEIRWKAEDNFGLKENAIAIRYSDDGGLTYPHIIAEDLENKSTFTWTTSKHLYTDKVRLKIETEDQAGLANSNVSPSSFTVMPLIINITQPNGGELWNGMTLQTIKWTSNFNSGFVTLRYSTNGGQTWPHTIATGLENKLRKYDWEVPQINVEQVKVKAELTLQNQTHDESDHFEIQHHAPVVTIIYPIGGETWEANSTNEIRWTAEDSHFDLKDNPISILFSKDGGNTFNDSIAVKIKNDSLLYWTTPRDLNSSEVKIKVEAENVREVKGYDVLDENMAVLNPPPVITAIPDVAFENTGAAYFDLDPYVSDNNDRLIDITWSGWCEEPKIEIIINNENKYCTIIAREITGLFDVILTATDPWGDSASDTLQIDVSGPTAVASPIVQSGPTEFILEQNVPNPFNPQTTLRYGLPEASSIQILVFNMAGKQVAELYNGHQSRGYHTVTWHALDQPTGVYFIRMMVGDFHDMRKCVLMK